MSSEGRDFFFDIGGGLECYDRVRAVLRRLTAQYTRNQLTGLHVLYSSRKQLILIGASFMVDVNPEAVVDLVGADAKLTELTLNEVMRRMRGREFDVALLGNAAQMLGVE